MVDGERGEEGEQVVGVESGGIESDVEVDSTMAAHEIDESLAKLGIAGGRLDDFEVRGGALEIRIEEGGIVAVARRVDADADGRGGARRFFDGRVANGRRS